MKILATGLSGLVGSRIEELLKNKYQFESSKIDITDKERIQKTIQDSDSSVILHLAAKTDVDECEKDKSLGEDGEAWRINVNGTENIAQACRYFNKKLIYVSTDFVFDGEKKEPYDEDDKENPINWYGRTKFRGEEKVREICKDFIIARISYPYRVSFLKLDFIRKLIELLKSGKNMSMVEDHLMTPTFIDDIAFAFDRLLDKNLSGVFNISGSQIISPYDTAILIADVFGFDKINLSKTTRGEFFNNRAPRGFNSSLKNDKISRLGIKMKTLEEGLMEIKNQ